MNTHGKILNPQAAIALFGELPSFVHSEILEILFKRDEPRISMKLMTSKKAKNPPLRWPKNYDVVHVGISFIGAQNVVIDNWGHDNIIADFSIEPADDAVVVCVSCVTQTRIKFECDWISFDDFVPELLTPK